MLLRLLRLRCTTDVSAPTCRPALLILDCKNWTCTLYCNPVLQEYSQLEGDRSHAVNPAWALLGLLASGYQDVDPKPLLAAARCLVGLQEGSGDWPQQHISGVFNRNCMITYANYRWVGCPRCARCAVHALPRVPITAWAQGDCPFGVYCR